MWILRTPRSSVSRQACTLGINARLEPPRGVRVFRLCRSSYPAYRWRGVRPRRGRWNSKGVGVLYMSENRSARSTRGFSCTCPVTLPDKYLLGASDTERTWPSRELLIRILPEGWSA